LQGDLVSAQLVANVVEKELVERQRVVEICAGEGDLRRAVRARDRAELRNLLERFSAHEARGFSSWVLVDSAGELLACHVPGLTPPPRSVPPADLAWRDWFHGRGDCHECPKAPLAPIRRTHISQPFVSDLSAGRVVIAVSTPVFAPEDGAGEPALLGV